MTAIVEYPNDPASLSAVRADLRNRLAGLNSGTRERALLIVSELATNALLHAQSSFTLTVRSTEATIRLEVRDHGPGQPKPLHPTPIEPNGRGLFIVASLSDSWGVNTHDNGTKTVWAELAKHPQPETRRVLDSVSAAGSVAIPDPSNAPRCSTTSAQGRRGCRFHLVTL